MPCSPPGDLPDPGTEPASPALAGRFFTTRATVCLLLEPVTGGWLTAECRGGGSALGRLLTPGEEVAGAGGSLLGPGWAALEQCWPCLEQWGFRAPGGAFEVRQVGSRPVRVAVPVNVRVEGYLVDSIYQDSLNTEEKPDCPWLGRAGRGRPFPPLLPGRPATVSGCLPRKGVYAEPHAHVLLLVSSGPAVSTPGHFSVCGPPPPELAPGSAGLSWDQCLGSVAPFC